MRPIALAGAIYLVLALLITAPFIFFHQTLYLGDITYNNEPAVRFMREIWQSQGHCPLWNPYILCGAPGIQLLWPISYLPGLIMLLCPYAIGVGLLLALHYWIAGIGGFLWHYFRTNNNLDLAQATGQDNRFSAALLFGMVFMLCGYMTGCEINPSLLGSAAWIPLVLFALERMFEHPRPWSLGLLGFILGLQISSGVPVVVALSSLLYVLYAVWWLKDNRPLSPNKSTLAFIFKPLSMLFTAFIIGFAVAAMDILPILELAKTSPAVGDLATLGLTYWSCGWFDLLGMITSQPFGHISIDRYHLYATYPNSFQYISSLFISAPIETLALFGILKASWKQRWFWCVWGLITTWICLGDFGPLSLFLHTLPSSWLVFRFPIKVAIFFLLSVAIAASEGWTALVKREVNCIAAIVIAIAWTLLIIQGLLLLALPDQAFRSFVVSLGVQPLDTPIYDLKRFPLELVIAGLTGLLPCLLVLRGYSKEFSGQKELSRKIQIAFISMVATLLLVNGALHLWQTVDVAFFKKQSPLYSELVNLAKAPSWTFRVLSLIEEPLPAPPAVHVLPNARQDKAFMQYTRLILCPNTSIDCNIQLTNGVSIMPAWNTFFLSTGILPRSTMWPFVQHPAGKSDIPLLRWCQATSSRFILTSCYFPRPTYDGELLLEPLDRKFFKLVKENRNLNLRIYELPSVRPRFALFSHYRLVGQQYDALKTINRSDTNGFDPISEVLITDLDPNTFINQSPLENHLAEDPSTNTDTQNTGTLDLKMLDLDQIKLEANLSKPAFLVITDSYYPGWEARDNGKPTKIYLADGLLRAVHLEPGKHEVIFVYKPRSLFWGEIITEIAFILIVLLMATALFKLPSLKPHKQS